MVDMANLPDLSDTSVMLSSGITNIRVSTPGWWANIFLVVFPTIFLVTLYNASERSKLEEGVDNYQTFYQVVPENPQDAPGAIK